MAEAGGDDQPCRSPVASPACSSRIWGWVTWTASVFFVSFALTAVMSVFNGSGRDVSTPPAEPPNSVDPSSGPLIVDLRKRSSCTSGGVAGAVYDTPLHVGALLIVWFVSTLACAFPLLASKYPGLHIPPRFFFVVRHFGTGVLIATAFVHLLPTAFISLGDPCLGDFWVKDYPAMPGAIALAAIFFVTVVEMIFHPARRCTTAPSTHQPDEQAAEDQVTTAPDSTRVPMRNMAPPRARTSSVGHGLNRLPTAVDDDRSARHEQPLELELQPKSDIEEAALETVDTSLNPPTELKLRKERLQCVLLELGILFHSVFIGMALSVSVGSEFVILLIAIVFHRKSRLHPL